MAEEPMTLSEMLRNPQRKDDGSFDEEFNRKAMDAAAELLELKLPCEVHVEPGTLLKKGAHLESLLLAIQGRC